MTTEIANRLCAYRKHHGISQEELAEKLAVSRQAISKWERAEASPDTDNLISLSQVYEVTLDALLYADPQSEKKAEAEISVFSRIFRPKRTAEKQQDWKAWKERWDRFPFSLLCLFAYLVMGAFHILGGWAWGWLIVLTIPLYYTLGDAIASQNASNFWFPVFVVLVYVILGLSKSWWHPGWILFGTIPLYYCLCDFWKKGRHKD